MSTGPILFVDISNYIALSAVIFFIGVAGVIVRREPRRSC